MRSEWWLLWILVSYSFTVYSDIVNRMTDEEVKLMDGLSDEQLKLTMAFSCKRMMSIILLTLFYYLNFAGVHFFQMTSFH